LRVKLERSSGTVAVPQKDLEALGVEAGTEVDVLVAPGAVAIIAPAASAGPYFAGTLSAFSMVEVVQAIYSSLKSGRLLLRFSAPSGEVRKTIDFRDGEVCFASSTEACDRLGAVLWRRGMLDRVTVERCGEKVGPGRPLGKVLLEDSVLTAAELYQGLSQQVREIVLSIFLERTGEFVFLEGTPAQGDALRLSERTRELLLDGVKRLQELERIESSLVADPDAVVFPAPGGAPPKDPAEARVLELAEGERTVAEIIGASRLGRFAGYKAVANLIAAGWLRDIPVPPAPPPAPEPEEAPAAEAPPLAGPFEAYRRMIKYLHGELRTARPEAVERLASWFDRLSEAQKPLFAGVRFAKDGDLDVVQVLINASRGGSEPEVRARARALEALEAFHAFALFTVKDALPKDLSDKVLQTTMRMQMGLA
jgi:hypothetical protein